MKAVSLAVPLLLCLAAPAPAQHAVPRPSSGAGFPPPQPTYSIRNARVMAISIPPVGSGILHVYAIARVRAPGPVDLEVRWTWFGGDQFAPPVGSICTFTFHNETVRRIDLGVPDFSTYARPPFVVIGYACDTGSDPLTGPPAAE